MSGEQLTVILRRTADGGWEVGGALGKPGADHAAEVTGSFREVDDARASFLAGVAAGTAGIPAVAFREFAE